MLGCALGCTGVPRKTNSVDAIYRRRETRQHSGVMVQTYPRRVLHHGPRALYMPASLLTYIYRLRCLKAPFRGAREAQANLGPERYIRILPKKGTPITSMGAIRGVIYIYILSMCGICAWKLTWLRTILRGHGLSNPASYPLHNKLW